MPAYIAEFRWFLTENVIPLVIQSVIQKGKDRPDVKWGLNICTQTIRKRQEEKEGTQHSDKGQQAQQYQHDILSSPGRCRYSLSYLEYSPQYGYFLFTSVFFRCIMENTIYVSIPETAAAGNTSCRFRITAAPSVWQIRLAEERAAHGYKRYRRGIEEFFHLSGTSPAADDTDIGLALQSSASQCMTCRLSSAVIPPSFMKSAQFNLTHTGKSLPAVCLMEAIH